MLSDGAGVVRGTFTFDSYGNLTAATGSSTSSFWFSGQYRDSETGLIYLRARYYDPVTGQFISRDPAVAATRQPYGYTGDNPLNAVDPSGLYEYYASFGLGNWGASGATDGMAILQSYPSASFPWPISGDQGETSIKKGSTYTLTDRPIPFHDTDRVKVTAMTATSFSFTALAGHIEGEGGTITFSTYVDSNGNTILQMHAKGPDFLGLPFWPVNEARFAEATKFWGRMAENVLAQLQLEHMNDTPCDFLWWSDWSQGIRRPVPTRWLIVGPIITLAIIGFVVLLWICGYLVWSSTSGRGWLYLLVPIGAVVLSLIGAALGYTAGHSRWTAALSGALVLLAYDVAVTLVLVRQPLLF